MNNTKRFSEDLACNIVLISALVFSFLHLIILTLNLFHVTHFEFYSTFNYVVAYVLVIVCLALYIFSFYLDKLSKLFIPSWFKIMFFIAFFLFTNVYYILNWFNSIWGLVFFFAYISFLVCIICLSVYFNTQKDEKNRLKIAPSSLLTSVFFYSVALNAILQFLINLVKVVAFNSYKFATLSTYLIEFGTMFGINIFVLIAFAISLTHSKTFINACLIKVNNR